MLHVKVLATAIKAKCQLAGNVQVIVLLGLSCLELFRDTDDFLVDKWEHHVTLVALIGQVRRIHRGKDLRNLVVHFTLASIAACVHVCTDLSEQVLLLGNDCRLTPCLVLMWVLPVLAIDLLHGLHEVQVSLLGRELVVLSVCGGALKRFCLGGVVDTLYTMQLANGSLRRNVRCNGLAKILESFLSQG